MLRRGVLALAALLVGGVPVSVVVPASGVTGSAEEPRAQGVRAPFAFSPNGDGVRDTLRVRFGVPSTGDVTVRVYAYRYPTAARTVRLGDKAAGVHTWTWDGRTDQGRKLPDDLYEVEVTSDLGVDDTGTPLGVAVERDLVWLDTEFVPELTTPTYGVPERKAVARVFPRTKVVRDAVELDVRAFEPAVSSMRLVIRNSEGRVVRRSDVDGVVRNIFLETLPDENGQLQDVPGRGRTARWTARRGGKPLPSGRYTAVVTGRDRAGNTGRSERVRIWVSTEKLERRSRTVSVAPATSRTWPCAFHPGERCGDLPPCSDVVASDLFDKGLSYHSDVVKPYCSGDDRATQLHLLEVPAATGVRGVEAVRVSFTGAPTTAGETDTGMLTVPGDASSQVVGTSGQSAWVGDPSWGRGLAGTGDELQRDPAATWAFSTDDGDWFDVERFTVDVRYLAIKD